MPMLVVALLDPFVEFRGWPGDFLGERQGSSSATLAQVDPARRGPSSSGGSGGSGGSSGGEIVPVGPGVPPAVAGDDGLPPAAGTPGTGDDGVQEQSPIPSELVDTPSSIRVPGTLTPGPEAPTPPDAPPGDTP